MRPTLDALLSDVLDECHPRPTRPDGEAARPLADGAGQRAVALVDNDAAVDWLRGHLAASDVVLVKASRGARLDEVAAALA